MKRDNKIRKKCSGCSRTYVVPLFDDACPHCPANLEMFSHSFEDSALNLIAIMREIHRLHRFKESELLEQCLEDLEQWSEHPQSPQEIGWVGQDGLP